MAQRHGNIDEPSEPSRPRIQNRPADARIKAIVESYPKLPWKLRASGNPAGFLEGPAQGLLDQDSASPGQDSRCEGGRSVVVSGNDHPGRAGACHILQASRRFHFSALNGLMAQGRIEDDDSLYRKALAAKLKQGLHALLAYYSITQDGNDHGLNARPTQGLHKHSR